MSKVRKIIDSSAYLLFAAVFLYFIASGLITGEVIAPSKYFYSVVSKTENPDGYWFSIAIYVVFFAFLSYEGCSSVKKALKYVSEWKE